MQDDTDLLADLLTWREAELTPLAPFRVPRRPMRKLARVLFDKLTADECCELADSLYDHLGIPRPV